MTTQVSIREKFKRIDKHNPISGHQWTEHGETIAYQVIGATGVHSQHKTLEKARIEARELQSFYDKFNL